MPTPWGDGGAFGLTDDLKHHSGSYTVNANECVAIAFVPPKGGCLLDDVTVAEVPAANP